MSILDQTRFLLDNLKKKASSFVDYTVPQTMAQFASNPGLNKAATTFQNSAPAQFVTSFGKTIAPVVTSIGQQYAYGNPLMPSSLKQKALQGLQSTGTYNQQGSATPKAYGDLFKGLGYNFSLLNPSSLPVNLGIASTLGAFTPQNGETRSQAAGRSSADILPFVGLTNLTTPLINKVVPAGILTKTGIGGRTAQGALNFAENRLQNIATGNPNSLSQDVLSFVTGAGGKPFQPTGKVSKFSLPKNTMDEVVQAEDMIRNPENWLGKVKINSRTKKDALKEIQSMGSDTIERISGTYLPTNKLESLKTVEAKIKALVDLSAQNKLTYMPGIVGKKSTEQSLYDTKVSSFEDWLGKKGISKFGGDVATNRLAGASPGLQERIKKSQEIKRAEHNAMIDKLRKEFDAGIQDGSIKLMSRTEKLIETAKGHPDLESTQAARRVLAKKGIDWRITSLDLQSEGGRLGRTEYSTKNKLLPEKQQSQQLKSSYDNILSQTDLKSNEAMNLAEKGNKQSVFNVAQGGLSEVKPSQPTKIPKVENQANLQPVGDILKNRQQPIQSSDYASQRPISAIDKTTPEVQPTTPSELAPSSPSSITQGDKYAFSINKGKLNIGPEAKTELTKITNDIKPELQAVKGRKLTNEEILQSAAESQILRKVVNREDTLKVTAAITKLRQRVAAGANDRGLTPDFIENVKTLNSIAADTGRRLQSFNIGADPISTTGVKEELIARLLKLGKSTEDILKASEGVDFNNPKQVTDFYRQFVKPNIGDIISEYRYMNLLSSPKTHITNAFSNALQATVVSPVTKLASGTIDAFGSAVTGKQRQYYTSEVPAYYKGLFNSVGEAYTKALDAFKGNSFTERPDIGRLPTNSKLTKYFQPIPRALEASDVFFRTMIAAGEKEALLTKYAKQGRSVSESVINKQAMDKASYYVFRKALDPNNASKQGALLSYIDKFTTAVYGFRKVPGVSWFIPFVQTPMNILKQGIEYSPLGVATLPGAGNKTEQLGKALTGSMVFAGAAYLSQVGDSTWAAPTGQKEKEDFYASGRQPYSIKIGNQWVSYSRLGPLAYPIAMAGAIKYYTEQDPKAITRSKLTSISKAIGGMAKFFSDQSYLQGIGDLVKTAQGDTSAAQQTLANIPSQLVPLSALTGWVARLIDPIYRHPGNVVESIKSQIPFASKTVAPYTNPAGLPSQRANNMFNSFSPVGITPQTGYNSVYQNRIAGNQYDSVVKQIKDLAKSGDTQGAMKLLRENRDILSKGAVSNKIDNANTKLQQTRDKIKNSKLPEDQKQRLYKLLEKQMLEQSSINGVK